MDAGRILHQVVDGQLVQPQVVLAVHVAVEVDDEPGLPGIAVAVPRDLRVVAVQGHERPGRALQTHADLGEGRAVDLDVPGHVLPGFPEKRLDTLIVDLDLDVVHGRQAEEHLQRIRDHVIVVVSHDAAVVVVIPFIARTSPQHEQSPDQRHPPQPSGHSILPGALNHELCPLRNSARVEAWSRNGTADGRGWEGRVEMIADDGVGFQNRFTIRLIWTSGVPKFRRRQTGRPVALR